jgi:hypothetical protein
VVTVAGVALRLSGAGAADLREHDELSGQPFDQSALVVGVERDRPVGDLHVTQAELRSAASLAGLPPRAANALASSRLADEASAGASAGLSSRTPVNRATATIAVKTAMPASSSRRQRPLSSRNSFNSGRTALSTAPPTRPAARLHANRKGRVRLVLRCPPAIACHGTVSLTALVTVHVGHGRHRHRYVVRVALAHASFAPRRGQFLLTLHLGKRARALLRRHHHKLHVAVTVGLPRISAHTVGASLSG